MYVGNRRRALGSLATSLLAALAVAPASGNHRDGERGDRDRRGPNLFISSCDWSHSAKDDPIVHRGHAGMSHRHDFFGNTSTNSRSTSASLRRSGTNCSVAGDHAAYWAPSLQKKGRFIRPSRVIAWYVNNGSGRRIKPFPRGLKMIAGDAHAKAFQSPGVVNWSCEDNRFGRASDHFGGGERGFRNAIPSCRDRGVQLRINFPSCWDGKRRDSRDHKRHMAYREYTWRGESRCPRSHPVPVPALILDVIYPIRNGYKVFLASGRVRTAHADFFNGWDQGRLGRMTGACLARARGCFQRWWR